MKNTRFVGLDVHAATIAVALELLGFIWAIGVAVERQHADAGRPAVA